MVDKIKNSEFFQNAIKKTNKNNVQNYMMVLAIFIIMLLIVELGLLGRYWNLIFISVLIFIVLSTTLNVSTGFLGQLVLGHAGFVAVGAYTAALTAILLQSVFLESDGFIAFIVTNNVVLFAISAIAGMVMSGFVGLLVGTPALRLRGDYLGIMTLGFGEIIRIILNYLKVITNGAQGLKYDVEFSFATAFITAVIVVTIIFLFMNSRHGRAIISIREDEIASESVGINIVKYKLIGFVFSAGLAGVGGAMFAFKEGFIKPDQFDFMMSVEIFVIVVLGGIGSISGSIVAAIALTIAPEILRSVNEYRYLIYSTLLIVMMLFRPQGLMGDTELSAQGIYNFFKKLFGKAKSLFLKKEPGGTK